jgi:hypothetical protein
MFLALRSPLLRLRYTQRNLLAIGCGDKSALFLRCRQSRLDVSKGYRVCADAELGTPSIQVSDSCDWKKVRIGKHTPLQ